VQDEDDEGSGEAEMEEGNFNSREEHHSPLPPIKREFKTLKIDKNNITRAVENGGTMMLIDISPGSGPS